MADSRTAVMGLQWACNGQNASDGKMKKSKQFNSHDGVETF